MITVRRVLCPVDFLEYSKRALSHASAIAERNRAGLTVLHVEDVLLAAARAKVDRYSNGFLAAEDELRAFVGSVVPRRSNVRTIVTSGNPVTNIVEHATRHSDLIVMGTGGRAGVSRLVLGSVTEGVVARATCPVLTIPPGAHPPDTRLESHERILCASDFSPSCRLALDVAMSLADRDARLIFMSSRYQLQRRGCGPARLTGMSSTLARWAGSSAAFLPARCSGVIPKWSWPMETLPRPSCRSPRARTSI